MSTLPFVKMHGLGNDFAIIDALKTPVHIDKATLKRLANRHLGIGFDQLLVIKPGDQANDFICDIYNADGSQAEQCGNGLRCVAYYLSEAGLCGKSCTIQTLAGRFPVTIKDREHICINMGVPSFSTEKKVITLPNSNKLITIDFISMGNPHVILRVDDLAATDVTTLGSMISKHEQLMQELNVGFLEVANTQNIHLRTYERGVGQTKACGSNACAAMVVARLNQWAAADAHVHFELGKLLLNWQGVHDPVFMTGPAEEVYRGEVWI